MTIENRTYSLIEDISITNSLISFGPVGNLHLSASAWSSTRIGGMRDFRGRCLSRVLARVKRDYPLAQLWLIVSQKAIQSDNRITRYNKLWRSLDRQGIRRPPDEFVEHAVNLKPGLRFCGAAPFGLSDVEWANQIMSRERASVLVVHSHEAEIAMKELIGRGEVVQESQPAVELLRLCELHDVAVVDVFGEFDDREVVVTIVGRRQMIVVGDH